MLSDYLATAHESFSERSLSEVDSLVLSTVAYLRMEEGRLADVGESCLPLPLAVCGIPHELLMGRCWLSSYGGSDFLAALLASRRFCEAEVGWYVESTVPELEKQFCAMTFSLPDGSRYVAFRGTDSTLLGWKEDFNLSFMVSTPGQRDAAAYLGRIARSCDAPLHVGGHSKGGNLAEYAALACSDATFERIVGVYNHDGPSFCEEVSPRMASAAYAEKLCKSVPQSSVFGLLMEQREDFHVIEAEGKLFQQHASTNWKVTDGGLVPAEELNSSAHLISQTLTAWALMYPPAKRALFIDSAFEIFAETGVTSWSELNEDHKFYARVMFEAARKVDPELRSTMFSMLGDAVGILRENVKR